MATVVQPVENLGIPAFCLTAGARHHLSRDLKMHRIIWIFCQIFSDQVKVPGLWPPSFFRHLVSWISKKLRLELKYVFNYNNLFLGNNCKDSKSCKLELIQGSIILFICHIIYRKFQCSITEILTKNRVLHRYIIEGKKTSLKYLHQRKVFDHFNRI